MLHPSILESVHPILEEEFIFPKDILNEIKKNKVAWKNFQKFSEAYKRIRIGFINDSRIRSDIFKQRLNYFIKMTAQNKQYGLKGIEKYL